MKRHGCLASGLVLVAISALLSLATPTSARAEDPVIRWSWSFPPPGAVNDNVETVLGGPDIDGDGYPDALAACQDYTVRALSGHSTGTATVIWTFGGTDERPEEDTALALFPDRTGDGRPEILYNTAANDRSVHMIRSSDGGVLWSYDLRNTGCTTLAWIYQAVPVGDLDGDGTQDVAAVSGAQCNKVLALSGASGSLLWQFTAADGCRSVGAAGDMTEDGTPDVLAGCGTNNIDNRLLLLDGRVAAPARVVWEHSATKMVATVATTHDISGDKVDDAIGGAWDGTVFSVAGESRGTVLNPLWEHAVGGSSTWVSRALRIPDSDGDCVDDLAVASWTGTAQVLSGSTGAVLWSQPVGASYARTAAIVPDITGDQQWDVVYGTTTGGKVLVFSGADGVKLWEWTGPQNVRSVSWIGDIDDDGLPDILAGLQNNATVYAFSGRTLGTCIRPTAEVASVRLERLDESRIQIAWDASTDACHDRYRVYGVPWGVRGVTGCLAQLVDITDQDEDADATNVSWTGAGEFFGYLVIDQAADGGKGPLGHFRR